MTTQSRSLRFADDLSRSPYAWPGGYPRFAVLDDGEVLCKDCAKSERESIGTTTGHDGWCIIGVGINWEDPNLYCAHCNANIEAAYKP